MKKLFENLDFSKIINRTSLTQEEFDKLPKISQKEIQQLLDKGKEEANQFFYGQKINGVQYFV